MQAHLDYWRKRCLDTLFGIDAVQEEKSSMNRTFRVSASSIKKRERIWTVAYSQTMIHIRPKESMEKRIAYRKSIGRTTVPPGTLAEQVQYGKPVTNMPMWRTPDAAAGGAIYQG